MWKQFFHIFFKGSNQTGFRTTFFLLPGQHAQIQWKYFPHAAVDNCCFWTWTTMKLHPESHRTYLGPPMLARDTGHVGKLLQLRSWTLTKKHRQHGWPSIQNDDAWQGGCCPVALVPILHFYSSQQVLGALSLIGSSECTWITFEKQMPWNHNAIQASIRETMHPESMTHFRKIFPNTLMNDLNDVPLAGTPQLEQSGASSAKPFTGSWSMRSSANLSRSREVVGIVGFGTGHEPLQVAC